MNEEKDMLETEATEVTEEVVEEVAEEIIDEAVEAVEEDIEEAEDAEIEEAADEPKKTSVLKAVIITLIICAIIMVAEYFIINKRLNHYNLNKDGYSVTLGEAAEESGLSLEEFKSQNGLPEDMPADTTTAAAQEYITLGKMLEMNGMGADMLPMFAQMYNIDEALITEDMCMGELNKLAREAQKNAPAEGEEAPAEGEAAPAEGEAAPAEGEAAPAEVEEAPAVAE